MKLQPRRARPRATAADPAAAAPAVHPAEAQRAAAGPKGDAWVVSLPEGAPAAGTAVLALSTGRDSATIVIGDVHGPRVRVHPTHDLAVVVTSGSGVLRHGAGPGRAAETPYGAPCTIVIPAGTWHAVVPDAGPGRLVAFFTRPGRTIDPFAVVGPRAEPGLVHLDTLPVSRWPARPARVVDLADGGPRPGAAGTDRTGTDRTGTEPARPARVVPYEQPQDGYTLALDTGADTLFVMTSRGRSWDRAPVDVPVHRHDREDEFIVLDAGEGWLLNGGTQDSVARTPWRAPCVLVMPAGNHHRVVRTDDGVSDAILIYAHRDQVAGSWEEIVSEMQLGGDVA